MLPHNHTHWRFWKLWYAKLSGLVVPAFVQMFTCTSGTNAHVYRSVGHLQMKLCTTNANHIIVERSTHVLKIYKSLCCILFVWIFLIRSMWRIYPYFSDLRHCHWDNHPITSMQLKWPLKYMVRLVPSKRMYQNHKSIRNGVKLKNHVWR